MTRYNKLYNEEIIPKLQKELSIENKYAIPKIKKVVINVGIGKIRDNEKNVDAIKKDLALICGQMPATRKAKKAISGFKVRKGEEVGLMVTLRNDKMYDFIDKLANITLPRLRDFRGINDKSFDKFGNLTIGIRESIVFPELASHTENIFGVGVVIVINSKNILYSKKLLEYLGFPFNKKEKNG